MERSWLDVLDGVRRASGVPAGPVVREVSVDGAEARIVHSSCTAQDLPDAVRRELRRAQDLGAQFEWKLYGDDGPPGIASVLSGAGLVPGEREAVMVLDLCQLSDGLGNGPAPAIWVLSVGPEGLADCASVSAASGRTGVEEEQQALASAIAAAPDRLQVHVAYADGWPVSCGRLHLLPAAGAAELAGGRTAVGHRRRGHFTATVLSRIAAARAAGARSLWVDALPTSAPILAGLGFEAVSWTDPWALPG